MRGSGERLDLRIPWAYLTYSDPSSNRIWIIRRDGSIGSATAGPVGIDIACGSRLTTTAGFGWKQWQTVTWHERRKAGWDAVRVAIADTSGDR